MENLAMLAASPEAWAALATLIVLEVVLGIDNLIFISILTNRLPEADRPRARLVGISGALILRLALLSLIFVIVGLTAPVFTVFDQAFSWRDLILIAGGLFLVWKATSEIHHNVDPEDSAAKGPVSASGFAMVIGQILLLDLVFSMDSILTAVGMTPHLPIMVIAVVVSVGLMMFAAKPLAEPDRCHAGAGIPADDRDGADRRRFRRPCAQGLYLCRDVVLRPGRGPQHDGPAGTPPRGRQDSVVRPDPCGPVTGRCASATRRQRRKGPASGGKRGPGDARRNAISRPDRIRARLA